MSRANKERYQAEFRKADKDGSGTISKEELTSVLDNLGKTIIPSVVDKIFARLDSDGSGNLNEDEFLVFMGDIDNAWIRVQAKTFSRWASTVLSNRMIKCDDVKVEFRDGVKLAPLIEILSKKSCGKINPKPRFKLHRTENLNKCLNVLKEDGLKMVNIGSEDIEQGNPTITLGLIWLLILKYQIGDSIEQGSAKWALLEWVKKQIEPYNTGVKLKNFKSGWSDGKVLSALADSLGEPMYATLDVREMDPDPYEASNNAMNIAEEVFEIPKIMDAQDIVENPDEHSIMTYVSYFRDYADTIKSRSSPRNCTAHGPGVEGDSRPTEGKWEPTFTIVAKNKLGQEKKEGGDMFAANVTDPDGNTTPANIVDNGDGTYSGSYSVGKPGDYKVDIQLRNEAIDGSVFTPRMEAGNAGNSYAEGEGLSKGKTRRPAEFTIHSVDKDGNHVKVGGDPFEVAISGPSGDVVVDVEDQGDGTYSCKYNPNEEGDYNIGVTLYGEPIKDAPFTAHIKRAPNAANSWVDGPGLSRAFDNRPAEFTVHAMDDLGNPVSGDDCAVRIFSEDGDKKDVPVDVTDNGDGTYSCSYAPTEAGKFVIEVKLDGDDVKDTPKKIRIREGVDVSGMGKCKFKATIIARNKAGEAKTEGGDEWEVSIKGPDDIDIPVKATDNNDGSYSAEYKLDAPKGDDDGPQEFIISMTLNGDHIPGSPFRQFM